MDLKSSSFPKLHCWVSTCFLSFPESALLPLPNNVEIRESWLALAGKPMESTDSEEIKFCEKHFLESDVIRNSDIYYANGLPILNMPNKICRTCMVIIPDNQKFYVISGSIRTDMPKYVEEMMSPCISSSPTPLRIILQTTIPEIDVKEDPPSLMCNKCFESIWLYYMYKLSSVKNENTLRGNMSMDDYGKMVICRCCPKIFGVQLFQITDDSSKGSLLKGIFAVSDIASHVLPLRVCGECYNILQKLDEFRNKCLLVEDKLKRHISLEHDIERRKSCSALPQVPTETSRMIRNLKNSLQKYLNNAQNWKEVPSPSEGDDTKSSDEIVGGIKVEPGTSKSTIVDKQGTSKDHSSTIIAAHGSEEPDPKTKISAGRKKKKPGRKSGSFKKFSDEEKKILVKEVREEYVRLHKQDKLLKCPWQAIIKNLADRHVLECDFDRLNSMFSRLRMSAKIHEKDGRDVVDEELWELLEYHKNYQLVKKIEANQVFKNENSAIQQTDLQPAAKKLSTKIAEVGCKIKIETVTNNESEVPNKKPKLQIRWSEKDKLKIFKLIKQEFELMLKTNELCSKSWSTIIKRIVQKGYVECDETHVLYVWNKMRRSLMEHENTPDMTDLDWKVWRLLKRSKKVTVLKEAPKIKKEFINNLLPKKNVSDSVDEIKTRWTRQQKIDLIISVRKFGNAVFKKHKLHNNDLVWPKIINEFRLYGHNISPARIRACWNNMSQSAKLAMGDHKKKSDIDSIMIDFMKSIAGNKVESISKRENNTDMDQDEVSADHVEQLGKIINCFSVEQNEPIVESNEKIQNSIVTSHIGQNELLTLEKSNALFSETNDEGHTNVIDDSDGHHDELLAAISSIQTVHEDESLHDNKTDEYSIAAVNDSHVHQNELLIDNDGQLISNSSNCIQQEPFAGHTYQDQVLEENGENQQIIVKSSNTEANDNSKENKTNSVMTSDKCNNQSPSNTDDDASPSGIPGDDENEEIQYDSDAWNSIKYGNYEYVSRKDIESQLENTKITPVKFEEGTVIEVSSDSDF